MVCEDEEEVCVIEEEVCVIGLNVLEGCEG